jgi:Xaa-Pro aminopeptidase
MAVDWEQRIDFDRLRRERLGRIKEMLAKSEIGALLCFDMNNVRYITATNIGSWAQDKISRFTLLPQNDEPILWDFGSAARHHQLHCPWMGERSRAGIPLMRGAMTPEMGRSEDVAKKIRIELEARGLLNEPLGVDVVEPPIMFALQKEGHHGRGRAATDVRRERDQDRGRDSLLTQAAGMVDAAYYDLYRAMKPGMRESDAVGLVAQKLYEMGSEYVEGVNAISGERCSPHPHIFSDRVMRPGDPVYYDILHSYMGYRTCYYRSFAISSASRALVDAYKRCRDYLDAAIELVRPGRTTAEIAAVWPKAQEFGFPNEEAAFALQMGHGIGLAIWEKPMISRLVSLEHPHEIKPGMVFALETFWPSTDGWSAARIEEEIVVTPTGHEVITRFPAEELLIAGAPFVTVSGTLPTLREPEPGPNMQVKEMIAAAARSEVPHADPKVAGGLQPPEPRRSARNGRERRHACARDGAGNRQARVVAEERGGAGQEGRDAPRSRNRQGRRRSRSRAGRHPRRRHRANRRRRARRSDDRLAGASGRSRAHGVRSAGTDRTAHDGAGHRSRGHPR